MNHGARLRARISAGCVTHSVTENHSFPDEPSDDDGQSDRNVGTGLVLGLAMGLALGVLFEDIPLWLAIGAGLGLAFEGANAKRGDE